MQGQVLTSSPKLCLLHVLIFSKDLSIRFKLVVHAINQIARELVSSDICDGLQNSAERNAWRTEGLRDGPPSPMGHGLYPPTTARDPWDV
jgi:hypothetical protein